MCACVCVYVRAYVCLSVCMHARARILVCLCVLVYLCADTDCILNLADDEETKREVKKLLQLRSLLMKKGLLRK